MKIVLFALNASRVHTNLAVRSLRRSLESCGFSCSLTERNINDRHRAVLESLYAEKADLYGFSVYIWNREEMLTYASELKALLPEAMIFFGGPEVSFEDESFFDRYPFVSHLIRGEGEKAVIRLASDPLHCPRILEGIPDPDFENQSGICYRKGEKIPGTLLYYESSRGCPFRCGYCLSALSGKVRMKSAEQTLSDLLEFEDLDTEIQVVKFIDRTFNSDTERAKEIWKGLLSERYTKKYHFEICASLLDEETFSILSLFPKGKIQVEIGVQSANPDTLRAVHRDPDAARTIEKTARLKALGNVHVHADLIAGLPGESYDSFARSFDALWGKCDQLQLGFLKLLHGSDLRENAGKFRIVFSPSPPYEVLSTPDLSFEDLCRLHRIDDLNERFTSFGSLSVLLSELDSPFRFFEAFDRSLGERCIRSLSQNSAYESLAAFVSSLPLPDETLHRFLAGLILDYLTKETGRLPLPLRAFAIFGDKAEKISAFASVSEKNGSVFLPSSELVGFSFSGERYLVDRKNGVSIRVR